MATEVKFIADCRKCHRELTGYKKHVEGMTQMLRCPKCGEWAYAHPLQPLVVAAGEETASLFGEV